MKLIDLLFAETNEIKVAIIADHLVFSRLVRPSAKIPNFLTLVVSFSIVFGLIVNKMASPKSVFVSPWLGTCQMLSTDFLVKYRQ